MEVAVDQDKKQRGKGRAGSLENPETYENVPVHVIPIIEREFDDFDNEAEQFLSGQLEENQFIGFRLKQGVYGQRQPDVQMVRVKLPFGGVTPEQMEMFGDVVERYAPLDKGHITTRQNIQIHHVPLRDTKKLLREIADSGLSAREGCGNTIRNVTGDPWAGVSEGEPFDPTPYAAAYVRYFVRHPTTQLMPRKVKTAFTATEEDRAITGIHDVGFIPKLRDGVRGRVQQPVRAARAHVRDAPAEPRVEVGRQRPHVLGGRVGDVPGGVPVRGRHPAAGPQPRRPALHHAAGLHAADPRPPVQARRLPPRSLRP